MPNKDGTGPMGKGSKTGKQLGNCTGAEPKSDQRRCGRNFRKRNCHHSKDDE